jgi:hypothetical protein
MVYDGPKYRPQPDDAHRHDKGWHPAEPSWDDPRFFAPKKGTRKEAKQPEPPRREQLNLFKVNGIDPNSFRTPFGASRTLAQLPLKALAAVEAQESMTPWQRSQALRKQRALDRAEREKYQQLDWFDHHNFEFNNIDPALVPFQSEPQDYSDDGWPLSQPKVKGKERRLKVTTGDPKVGRMSRSEQEQRIQDGTLSTRRDFSGLRAVSDDMTAHPEHALKEGNKPDVPLMRAQAFKEKEAQSAAQSGFRSGFPSGGVQVAAAELSPGMLESSFGSAQLAAPGQVAPSAAENPKIPDRLAQNSPFYHLPPDTRRQILTHQPMKNAADLEAATIQQLYHFQDAEFAHRAVEARLREEARRSAWLHSVLKFGAASPNDDPGYDVGFFRSGKPHQTEQGRFAYDVTLGRQAEAYYRFLLPKAWAKWQEQKAQARRQHDQQNQDLKAQQQAQQKARQQAQQVNLLPKGGVAQSVPGLQGGAVLSPIPFGKTGLTVSVPTQGQAEEEIVFTETPVAGFQRELVNTATQRLQANKVRLNTQQKTYAKDLSPNSPRWSELRQLSQQDQILVQRQQRLNQQAAALQEKHRPGANLAPGDTRAEFLNDIEVRDPTVRSQIDELHAQVRMLEQTRTAMQAQTPALAVIDTAKVAHAPNTQQNNQAILKDISKGFGDINHGIDTLQGQIAQDPNKALLLDDVKAATLHKMGIDPKQKNHTPQQQAVIDYLGKEAFKDNLIKWGGLAGAGALTVGAIIGAVLAPQAVIPAWLMGGATVLGAGTAAYDVLQLITIDQGAQAGQAGGQKLTSVDPETARFNLTMGYGNLALSALDVGMTAKEAVAIAKLPVMRGLAGSLSAQKLTELMRGIKAGAQGRMSEALTAIRKLKGKISPEVEQELMQTMRSAGSGGNMAQMADGRKVQRSSLFDHMTQRLEGLGDRLGVSQMADWVNRKVDGLVHPFEGPQRDYAPAGGPMGESTEKTTAENLKDAKALQSKGNAGGTATAKKKLKNMTPAERLADAQGKYGHLNNWDAVEPLIGTAVNSSTKLPAGYRLFQKPGRGKQLFILRENVEDASVVPLMIENGKIQAGKTRLSRGLDAMKANLKAVGIETPKGYQLNHLVPDAVAQSDPMVVEILKRNIYDVDHAGNLLPMPGEVRGAHPDLTGHYGSHGNYNELVKQQLRQEKTILVKEYGSLDKVPDNELEAAVQRVEKRMRKGIMKRDPKIPTRYDPETGTRVLSEGLSDPDFIA